jgi:hypothetical protein
MSIDKSLNLCNLAAIVYQVLSARHHPSYVAQKMRDLDGQSAPDVLQWAVVYLDPENQRSLADAIGMDPSYLPMLRRAFEKVRHARPLTKRAP